MSQADSSQFYVHVLQDCQKSGFPCIPDVENPVVSIYYIAACWMGYTDDHSVKEIIDTAQQRGLIRCTIRRQPCIRISDSREIIIAASERSDARASVATTAKARSASSTATATAEQTPSHVDKRPDAANRLRKLHSPQRPDPLDQPDPPDQARGSHSQSTTNGRHSLENDHR